jgi:hypothetical protein
MFLKMVFFPLPADFMMMVSLHFIGHLRGVFVGGT